MIKTSLIVFSHLFSILAHVGSKDAFSFRVEASDNKVAKVYIKGTISEWSEYANSNNIDKQINDLVEAGHKDAEVYINSKGGDVFEAAEIMNSLRRFPGKLTAIGGAIVASAGSYIAVKCDEFHVRSNTQFMHHEPRMYAGGTLTQIQATLKLLENMNKDYIKAYVDKTGKKEDDIKSAWANGDTWLMGKEVVSEKFADKMLNKEAPITAEDVVVLEACAAPVIPKVTSQKLQNTEMDKVKIIAALGLPADATEQQIEAALADNKAKADKATQLEAAANAAAVDAKKAKVNALVEKAIGDKKITADQKETYVTLANADYDACEKALNALSAPVKPQVTSSASASNEDRSKWTYADYQEKAPQAFMELDESTQNTLIEAHYSTQNS